MLMAKGEQQWLCTAGTVTPEPTGSRERQEKKIFRSSWKKHAGMRRSRRDFLPLVAFTEKPHMDSIPTPSSSTPETMCPGKCKHHLCAFNIPVLSQLQPLSTPPLFNDHWHLSGDLVVPWLAQSHCHHSVWLLCNTTVPPGVALVSGESPKLNHGCHKRGCAPKEWWSPLQSLSFRAPQAKKSALLQGCREVPQHHTI